MKLFCCKSCKDIVTMRNRMRRCYCGASFGRAPTRVAVEVGGDGVVLEVPDDTLYGAIATRDNYRAKPFSAWVASKNDKSIVYVARDESQVLELQAG